MIENRISIKHPDTLLGNLDHFSIASLMLMLLLVPLIFYKNEYIWTKIFVLYLFLWPVVIAYFLRALFRKSIDFFYTPVIIPLLLLDIVAGISVFHAYNHSLAVQTLVKQIAYQAPFFLAIYYARHIKLRTVAAITIVVSIAVSVFGMLQFFHVISPPVDPWGRPNPASTMGLTNFTTDYLIMVIPLMFTVFLKEYDRSPLKYAAYAGIVLSLCYIVIGRNRAGWLAMVISVSLYAGLIIAHRGQRSFSTMTRKTLLYSGIAAVIAIVAVAGFTREGSNLVQRGASIINKDYPSNAFRLLVWDSTLKGVKDEPVFGVGIGNYQINIPLYEVAALKSTDWHELRYLDNAHNEYLQILFELGIAGLVLLLWFLAEILITGIRSIRDAKDDMPDILWNAALLSGIAAALTAAFFTFNLENPASAMMFWMFAGLIIGKRRYRHFEDEYGFISILKKLSGFNWRWKYDLEIGTGNNYPLTVFIAALFLCMIVLLGNLTVFSHRQATANIYNMEAETYLDLKMPQKAMDIMNKAHALAPDDYIILYTLARAEAGSMDTADAIVNSKKVISLSPYFFYAHKLLGFLYYNKDNYAGAINEFSTSIELMPQSIKEVGPYLVSSYLSINDIDNAVNLANTLLKDDPKNDAYYFLLGTAYSMKSDYTNAIKYLKEAVANNPSDFNAVLNLTECLQKTSNYKDALDYAIRLTRIEPNNPLAWYTLARSYIMVHNEARTFDALARLFKINPSFKMTVVNDSEFAKLLGKPRMKELLTGKVFVFQPGGRKKKR